MWEFEHEETIAAPVNHVYDLMCDIPNYHTWNPFLIKAEGEIKEGGIVKGKSVLGQFTTSFRHKIFEHKKNESLCWRDFGFASLFVCGQRSRYVTTIDGATQFRCHLIISGPFSGLVKALFGQGLRDGIIAEARALKDEAIKVI